MKNNQKLRIIFLFSRYSNLFSNVFFNGTMTGLSNDVYAEMFLTIMSTMFNLLPIICRRSH